MLWDFLYINFVNIYSKFMENKTPQFLNFPPIIFFRQMSKNIQQEENETTVEINESTKLRPKSFTVPLKKTPLPYYEILSISFILFCESYNSQFLFPFVGKFSFLFKFKKRLHDSRFWNCFKRKRSWILHWNHHCFLLCWSIL
jgi:hypothetical protein